MRASTSLPLVTKPVEIDGHLYLDGGTADSVPVEHVLENAGFDRAIGVLTQDRSYQKSPYGLMGASRAADAGGTADSVPVEHVLENAGFDRAIGVLTQDRSYQKSPYGLMGASRAADAGYPYLLEAMENRHERYNEQREHIWEYERAGRALVRRIRSQSSMCSRTRVSIVRS